MIYKRQLPAKDNFSYRLKSMKSNTKARESDLEYANILHEMLKNMEISVKVPLFTK